MTKRVLKYIGGAISGIVLAVVTDVIVKAINPDWAFLTPLWSGVKSFAAASRDWLMLTAPILNLIWLTGLIILVVVGVNSGTLIWRHFRRPYLVYNNDIFDGIVWRWSYEDDFPVYIKPHCPECDVELEAYEDRDPTRESNSYVIPKCVHMKCINCNAFAPKYFEGRYHDDVIGIVRKRIEGKIRSGTWK